MAESRASRAVCFWETSLKRLEDLFCFGRGPIKGGLVIESFNGAELVACVAVVICENPLTGSGGFFACLVEVCLLLK